MYDQPEAKDVSVLTGLFTADGREKAWGRRFRELSLRFESARPSRSFPKRPDLPWDECTVDGNAMERFRLDYLASFEKENAITDGNKHK